jgi:proline iminopeptidase
MGDLFPPTVPYDQGMLDVGDGNLVYWEICGNPDGKPAVIVHGGPGAGCRPGQGKLFDPDRYRIVLFDQRGCGRSTPSASDPATDLSVNTTDHLIEDMERLRVHLGIEQWLLSAHSWGCTLSLAYAERYPAHVSQMVLAAVTTIRPREIDWLYRGAGRFFPEQWERFVAESGVSRDDDLLAAYARLTSHPDAAVREKATADFDAWEKTLVSPEMTTAPVVTDRPSPFLLALIRITAHYFSHAAWLEDGVLIREAGRLAAIPGLLIHGRVDLSVPPDTAWELSRAWPGAELHIFEGEGHLGGDASRDCMLDTYRRFAAD